MQVPWNQCNWDQNVCASGVSIQCHRSTVEMLSLQNARVNCHIYGNLREQSNPHLFIGMLGNTTGTVPIQNSSHLLFIPRNTSFWAWLCLHFVLGSQHPPGSNGRKLLLVRRHKGSYLTSTMNSSLVSCKIFMGEISRKWTVLTPSICTITS